MLSPSRYVTTEIVLLKLCSTINLWEACHLDSVPDLCLDLNLKTKAKHLCLFSDGKKTVYFNSSVTHDLSPLSQFRRRQENCVDPQPGWHIWHIWRHIFLFREKPRSATPQSKVLLLFQLTDLNPFQGQPPPPSDPSLPSPDCSGINKVLSFDRIGQYQDDPPLHLSSDWTVPVENTLQHLELIC